MAEGKPLLWGMGVSGKQKQLATSVAFSEKCKDASLFGEMVCDWRKWSQQLVEGLGNELFSWSSCYSVLTYRSLVDKKLVISYLLSFSKDVLNYTSCARLHIR